MDQDTALRIVHTYTQRCLAHGLIPKENVVVWSKSRIESGLEKAGTFLKIDHQQEYAMVDFEGEIVKVPLDDLIIANAVPEMEYHRDFLRLNEDQIVEYMVNYSITPDGIGGGYIMPRQVWAND